MITCLRQWPPDLPPHSASGGESEFLRRLPSGKSLNWYSSGRAALFDTLSQFGLRKGAVALMPAYIAAGVIDPVLRDAFDYPYAEINLTTRLSELTKTPVSRDAHRRPNFYVVRPLEDTLFNCPFVVASDSKANSTRTSTARNVSRKRVN